MSLMYKSAPQKAISAPPGQITPCSPKLPCPCKITRSAKQKCYNETIKQTTYCHGTYDNAVHQKCWPTRPIWHHILRHVSDANTYNLSEINISDVAEVIDDKLDDLCATLQYHLA